MPLTAILIGNETLTLECGRMWLARGHAIARVVTDSPDLRNWAASAGIVTDVLPGLAARLEGPIDWILSIANLAVLPASVLACAKGAVNFHDGPLPQHAGLNAPVWALLAGEATHGITWHHIAGGVDAGAVLVTRAFDIAPDDTALTLNTKCFAAGMDSFPDVITALEAGTPTAPRKPTALTRCTAAPTGPQHRGGSTLHMTRKTSSNWCAHWITGTTGTR